LHYAMTLKEELWALMPKFVESIKVTDNDIHGLKSINVVVNYRLSGKLYFLDLNFANKNHMTSAHIAKVVNSYLPKVD
jgi:hypothetical protein